MWLWPTKATPDMEQEGGRESAFPLMNGRWSNTHTYTHSLNDCFLPVFKHNRSAVSVCSNISTCQRLQCLCVLIDI